MNDQWYSLLEALELLPNVTWVNPPQAASNMESKIRQLYLASKLGFSVPGTLISNDPDAARMFALRCGANVVVKALYAPLIEEPDQDYFIFTNMVDDISAEVDDEIRLSPVIFQYPVIPKIDYRVTVIGDTVFPVQIIATQQESASLDWRTQKDGLAFQLAKLPADIESRCRDYVRECGLLFGAIDLVERDRQFYFLEINPNGEWGWLQKPNRIPIAETLCDLFIEKDCKGREGVRRAV